MGNDDLADPAPFGFGFGVSRPFGFAPTISNPFGIDPGAPSLFGLGGALSSAPPVARARTLTPSPMQNGMTDADFDPILADASRRSAAAVYSVWSREMPDDGPIGPPSPDDYHAIFSDLGRVQPLNVRQRLASALTSGVGAVTDPEGRTGNPLFVAGTTPEGVNVPLNRGSIAALGATMAYLRGVEQPGSDLGGTAFESGPPRAGRSNTAIELNIAPNLTGKDPAEVLAHEIGHTIHNSIEIASAPLAGANDAALKQFDDMATLRSADNHVPLGPAGKPTQALRGQSLADYRYFMSGQEKFAEGIRQYLTDPNGFKSRYPDAAKFLRGVVNSNQNMRKILMLSQADIDGATT